MEKKVQADRNKEKELDEELELALIASKLSAKLHQEAIEAHIVEDNRQRQKLEEARKLRVRAHYSDLHRQMYLLHRVQRRALLQRQDTEKSSLKALPSFTDAERDLKADMSISHANARELLESELRDRRQRWADEFLQTMTRHNIAQSKLIENFWEDMLARDGSLLLSDSQQMRLREDCLVGSGLPPASVSMPTKDLSHTTTPVPIANDLALTLNAAEQLQARLRALTQAQNEEKTALRECLARDEEKLKARIERIWRSQELPERRVALERKRRQEAEREAKEVEERFCGERIWFSVAVKERGEWLEARERRALEYGEDVRG